MTRGPTAMHWWRTFLSLALGLAAAAPASAAIAIPRGGEPVRGFLVRQDAATVVLDVPQADGRLERRTFSRSELDAFLVTVDPERLAALAPDDPKAYRNFAEELAEKKIDPEARAAALRLYLLAAWLDPQQLGRGSLLGMIALARSPAEEKKFRAMAYLLDAEHDRGLLAVAAGKVTPAAAEAGIGQDDRATVLRAVQLYRQGKPRDAATLLRVPRLKEPFNRLSPGLDYEAFLAACQAPGRAIPKPEVLAKTLLVELALSESAPLPTIAPSAGTSEADAGWGAAAATDQGPAPALRLETITEFDPRQTIYRDGKWTTP